MNILLTSRRTQSLFALGELVVFNCDDRASVSGLYPLYVRVSSPVMIDFYKIWFLDFFFSSILDQRGVSHIWSLDNNFDNNDFADTQFVRHNRMTRTNWYAPRLLLRQAQSSIVLNFFSLNKSNICSRCWRTSRTLQIIVFSGNSAFFKTFIQNLHNDLKKHHLQKSTQSTQESL